MMWDVQAQLKYYEEQAALGEQSALAKLEIVKGLFRQMMLKKEETIRAALQHAKE